MGAQRLREWATYYEHEPFDWEVQRVGFGTLAALISNLFSNSRVTKQIEDWMPDPFYTAPPLTWQQRKALMMQMPGVTLGKLDNAIDQGSLSQTGG